MASSISSILVQLETTLTTCEKASLIVATQLKDVDGDTRQEVEKISEELLRKSMLLGTKRNAQGIKKKIKLELFAML